MIDDAQLIQYLLQHHQIHPHDVKQAQQIQTLEGGFLYNVLIEHKLGDEENIVNAAADLMGIQCIHLDHFEFDPQATSLLSESMARRNTVFPLTIHEEVGRSELILAMVDPLDIMTMDEIATHIGVDIQPVLAGAQSIQRAIDRAYKTPQVDNDDPFANLTPAKTQDRNPADSWAAFFDDAQEQPPQEDSEVISQEMRDRHNSGPFSALKQQKLNEDSEPVLDLAEWEMSDQPKPEESFGQFLVENSEDSEQFNGTMLGSPFRSGETPKEESFDLFAPEQPKVTTPEPKTPGPDTPKPISMPAKTVTEIPVEDIERSSDDSEAENPNNFTQLGGFQASRLPKSTPKARKLETLRKRLEKKAAIQESSEVSEAENNPMTSIGLNLDDLVNSAHIALKSEADEDKPTPIPAAAILEKPTEAPAQEVNDNTPAQLAPESPKAPEQPASPPTNALGRLQLKRISIPLKKTGTLPNKIVENNPMQSPPSVQHIIEPSEISEQSEASEALDMARPSRQPDILNAFLEPSEAITGSSITGDDAYASPIERLEQSTEANDALTIEHVQRMRSNDSGFATIDVDDFDIEEALSDGPSPPSADLIPPADERAIKPTENNPALTVEHIREMQQAQLQYREPKEPEEATELPKHLTPNQIAGALVALLIKKGLITKEELIAEAENLPQQQELSNEQLEDLTRRFS